MIAQVGEGEAAEKLAERVSAAPPGIAAPARVANQAPALADSPGSPPPALGRRAYQYADPGAASIAAGADGW